MLAFLPRDPVVPLAELEAQRTAIEHDPEAPFCRALARLADELLCIDGASCPLPQPVEDGDFFEQYRRTDVAGGCETASPAAT